MEPSDIERIKKNHRPWPRMRSRHMVGCTCGDRHWPCNALLAARDAENRLKQREIEEWQRILINRKYRRYAQ
jgi:hypothetical protein